MKTFYINFYNRIPQSQAHHLYCERVFGRDLGQHGFTTIKQLDLLQQVIQPTEGKTGLDVGCGEGRITEFLSDHSNMHFTGLDDIPGAIRAAKTRTKTKRQRLRFIVGDINQLELIKSDFDLILFIDSIYFSQDYAHTFAICKMLLKHKGKIAIFCSYGREPWVPLDEFSKDSLAPNRTPLATALNNNDFTFQTWDLTNEDVVLARKSKAVLGELKGLFEKEDTLFIYENRSAEAEGIIQAIEEGLHVRYLYLAKMQ